MSSPARQFAVEVVQRLVEAGYQALWAGGCVRDFLLEGEPADFDVATDARPDQVRKLFGRRRTLAVGESFGVIIVLGPKEAGQVEVATFRTDATYSDGRRPDAITFSTPQEDALRRDFTINGMFYDPLAEELIDYVGGQSDLEARIVRAIGDPHARIEEDKLRMLRALRFAARFDFVLDESTLLAIRTHGPQIEVVSQERISDEFRKMLRHPSRARGMEMIAESGLLPHVLPEIIDCWGDGNYATNTLEMLQLQRVGGFELAASIVFRCLSERVATGPQDRHRATELDVLGKRLRLSNQECDDISWLAGHYRQIQNAEALTLAELKPLLADSRRDQLIEFARLADVVERHAPRGATYCEQYLQQTPQELLDPPPLLTGGDLIAMGQRPGKHFATVLAEVRAAQLNERLESPEQAMALANELLKQSGH